MSHRLGTLPGVASRVQIVRPLPRVAISASVRWLALIIATGFTFRLAWILISEWQPVTRDDASRYDFTARALLDGLGYVHLNGAPTAFWPPGYSLLLAAAYGLFGESIVVAQLLNLVLGTATVALVYLIGVRLLGRGPALVGAAIVTAFPSLIFFTAVTLSEVAFTFLMLLAVYLLIVEAQSGRDRDLRLLLGAGLVLGFAALMRGQALLLPLALIPFWLRSDIGWPLIAHKLVALALGIGIIVAPWSIRNTVQMDAPVLVSTNAGVNFWIGHNEDADGRFGVRGGDPLVYSHPELTTVQREIAINAEGFREGIAYAITHPAQEVALGFKKLFWLYYNDTEGLQWNEGHSGQPFLGDHERIGLLTLSNVYYFSTIAFMLLGIPLWFSFRSPGRVLLISLIAYWTLVHLAFFGNPRFHAPIIPLIALLAALPCVALWSGQRPSSPGDPAHIDR